MLSNGGKVGGHGRSWHSGFEDSLFAHRSSLSFVRNSATYFGHISWTPSEILLHI